MNERPLDIVLVGTRAQDVQRMREAFEADENVSRLRVVTSLGAARSCLAENPPDLVIVDLRLPDGSAAELLSAQNHARPLPILITADPDAEQEAASLKDAGATDYVIKSETTLDAMPRIARRVLALWNHIARQHEVEALLRESQKRLDKLYDEMPVGYLESDAEGRIIRANRTELEMLGRAANEVVGRQLRDFLAEPPGDPNVLRGRRRDVPLPERVFESTVRRKDGTTLPVRIEDRPLRDHGGRITGLRSCMVDLTDRMRTESERQSLEAQIRHAQKLDSLGLLAGGLAHDFNNLLVGILGNASLALMDLPPDSPTRQCIEQIEIAAQRAADLTNQMLAYSGRGKLVVQPLNLSMLVEEMAHLVASAISKKISMKYQLEDNLAIVEADATQIRQIVMNLITNAADAIGTVRGEITVRTSVVQADREYLSRTLLDDDLPEGCYVRLDVSDNGCGMDEETKARIFDPFFTSKPTGRGLGLAAVLGIVRSHQGTLRVDSRPGEGTRFTLLLPCSDLDAHESDHTADLVAGWLPRGTVLVIDDEPFVCRVARQILVRSGFRALIAHGGQEGIDTFRANADKIAAIVLDMTMHDMNGEEVFREIRAIRPDAIVILTSGYHETEIRERLGDSAPAGFVQKPYRAKTLMEALRRSLQG
ncbi:MAG: response regulator [Phycisphaerae bacterium]|nr:response regulator [Phycisphaerae bacterium]